MPAITINRIDVSNCYFYDEKSFATVSIEFAWENAPLGDSIVLEIPGKLLRHAYIDLPISNPQEEIVNYIPLSSPQVIAFELPADASHTFGQCIIYFSAAVHCYQHF